MVIRDWKHRTGASPSQAGIFDDDEFLAREAVHHRGALVWAMALILLLTLLLVGWYWSREPDPRRVSDPSSGRVPGAVVTTMLIETVDGLLDKPGGYLSNDLLPPGVWLDNIPNWEYGVLIQVRDLAKAMREAFSRSQSQSTEDDDLAQAEPLFNFDNERWLLPSTESQYRKGQRYLETYLTRISDDDKDDARFYPRADNLRYWLGTVETRLGSLSQRLSASVGQRRINTDLVIPPGQEANKLVGEVLVKTPWGKIDDVFYEARGSTWALINFLKAAEVEFAEVLRKKNAQASLRQIIRELEATQAPLTSPMILNGSGFGLLANHSLTMASHISRANAGIINLRELLSQG